MSSAPAPLNLSSFSGATGIEMNSSEHNHTSAKAKSPSVNSIDDDDYVDVVGDGKNAHSKVQRQAHIEFYRFVRIA